MIFELTVPPFIKTLKNLEAFFDKAAAYADTKKFDVAVLLKDRLAPDMFDLTRQVQIACDTAKLCASRLTGREAPVFEDNEKTLDELRTRIRKTIAFLETMKDGDYKEAATRKVSQPRWEGKWLTGFEFVQNHAIPNFYFHVTAAYLILRHNGIDLGKKDYLGPMPFRQP